MELLSQIRVPTPKIRGSLLTILALFSSKAPINRLFWIHRTADCAEAGFCIWKVPTAKSNFLEKGADCVRREACSQRGDAASSWLGAKRRGSEAIKSQRLLLNPIIHFQRTFCQNYQTAYLRSFKAFERLQPLLGPLCQFRSTKYLKRVDFDMKLILRDSQYLTLQQNQSQFIWRLNFSGQRLQTLTRTQPYILPLKHKDRILGTQSALFLSNPNQRQKAKCLIGVYQIQRLRQQAGDKQQATEMLLTLQIKQPAVIVSFMPTVDVHRKTNHNLCPPRNGPGTGLAKRQPYWLEKHLIWKKQEKCRKRDKNQSWNRAEVGSLLTKKEFRASKPKITQPAFLQTKNSLGSKHQLLQKQLISRISQEKSSSLASKNFFFEGEQVFDVFDERFFVNVIFSVQLLGYEQI